MHKYAAEYFKCNHCGFIQVESPHWLEEAYTSAITAHDIGLLHRNIKYSEHLTMLLYSFFGTKGHYLDTAGGYGIFTRLMRDKGCDFQHTDKYCENIFAKNFEQNRTQYNAITAFEVMEHVTDPIKFIDDEVSIFTPESLIFSTLTYEGERPKDDWWYYAFDTGQHISFYTKRSLEHLAQRLGYNYHPISDDLHIFTKLSITRNKLQKYCSNGLFTWRKHYIKKKLKKSKLKKKDAEYVKSLRST